MKNRLAYGFSTAARGFDFACAIKRVGPTPLPPDSLCAFGFPDYHKVGDEWDKLDYANLARVDRTIELTLMMIADDPETPHWNEGNPKTEKYVKAWREMTKP